MNKSITELTFAEAVKIIEANSKLREELYDLAMDIANDYVMYDYLHGWKGIDYGITASEYGDRGDYFTVTDNRLFLKGLKENQRVYGFLPDSYTATINRAEELNDRLIELEWELSIENYNRLEDRVNELIKELETECFKRIRSEYEGMAEIETLADLLLSNHPEKYEGVIIDTETWEAFQEIHYIKSYAA